MKKKVFTKNWLFKWMVEILKWLDKGRIAFLCFFVIAAAGYISLFKWQSEPSIRLTGLVLQILGMLFAIKSLVNIRVHFGQPPLRDLIGTWLKRVPKRQQGVYISPDPARAVASVGEPTVVEGTLDNSDQPVEKRIELLENNVEQNRLVIRGHTKLIKDLNNSLEKHKDIMKKEHKTIKKEVQSDSESLHTSDIITSIVALIWLLIGITMSTMAYEICSWIE